MEHRAERVARGVETRSRRGARKGAEGQIKEASGMRESMGISGPEWRTRVEMAHLMVLQLFGRAKQRRDWQMLR